jgi:hypothetical protein
MKKKTELSKIANGLRLGIVVASLFFIGCSSNKLIVTDCQRKNLTTLLNQAMEIDKVYRINLCGEYFDYSFDGNKYVLKRVKK